MRARESFSPGQLSNYNDYADNKYQNVNYGSKLSRACKKKLVKRRKNIYITWSARYTGLNEIGISVSYSLVRSRALERGGHGQRRCNNIDSADQDGGYTASASRN